jgi:N-acetylmuramic acid 6-phosphate etherase
MAPRELAELIAGENRVAVEAAVASADSIAEAMRCVSEAFMRGATTFYVGAGTSARIAAADAAEMPPTFGVHPAAFVAIVAGSAVDAAKEGAEDDTQAGIDDLRRHNPGPVDLVVGISASGNTPYVVAAVAEARRLAIKTIGIANNPGSPLLMAADVPVCLDTGAEVLAGSTRLKAGTAQKIALNTISTGAMVLAGRVRDNMMSHMTPKNAKLRCRAIGIVASALGIDEAAAVARLEATSWDISRAMDT